MAEARLDRLNPRLLGTDENTTDEASDYRPALWRR